MMTGAHQRGEGLLKYPKDAIFDARAGADERMGIIPAAISWLYAAVAQTRARNGNGVKFSVRLSALEISTNTDYVKDLLAPFATGEFTKTFVQSQRSRFVAF
jgi:hypothetical protein